MAQEGGNSRAGASDDAARGRERARVEVEDRVAHALAVEGRGAELKVGEVVLCCLHAVLRSRRTRRKGSRNETVSSQHSIRDASRQTHGRAAAVRLDLAVGEDDGADADEARLGRRGASARRVGEHGRRDGVSANERRQGGNGNCSEGEHS